MNIGENRTRSKRVASWETGLRVICGAILVGKNATFYKGMVTQRNFKPAYKYQTAYPGLLRPQAQRYMGGIVTMTTSFEVVETGLYHSRPSCVREGKCGGC